MPVFLNPITPLVVTGYYTNRAGIAGIIGDSNVVLWSQLEVSDNPTDVNMTILQAVLNRVDNYLNRRFREANFINPIPISSKDFPYIQDLAASVGAVYLYRGRPETMTDEGQDVAGRMQNLSNAVEEQLNDLILRGIDDSSIVMGDPGISVPQISIPAYPIVPFQLP
jgi:hypothetical protein